MTLPLSVSSLRGAAVRAALFALFVLGGSSCGGGNGAPSADLSEEITGGNGPFIGSPTPLVAPNGYEVHEYVAAGTAISYEAQGDLTDDGHWTFVPSTTAPPAAYRTRILVRRPASASTASGTVIVEWLNVSGGVDADPEWTSLSEEILRQGHTWVGVSAQIIGVQGGPVLVQLPGGPAGFAGVGLKAIDPARYASLSHPGDGYSFDIYTQIARALRAGGAALGGVTPTKVIAAGESQSAFALTTYYDGVQPLTHAFDGFFVHSRGSVGLPLVDPGMSADLAAAIIGNGHPVFRDDLDAPVMDLQSETDVGGILKSSLVRQPDSDRYRLWEVAGTAHADAHLLGSFASSIDCGVPVNNGPMHVVAKAALHGLEAWVRTKTAPPIGARLEVDATGPVPFVVVDADGIALGGIRTPPVDVPVDVLSGSPAPGASILCVLLGSTTPLPDARITALYASSADYQAKYDASTDATIQAGFTLEADRAALEAYAQPSRVP